MHGRLRSEQIPRHVAIIMDGNGRWAERRGISRIEGHREGLEAIRDIVRGAHELGVGFLTLYAFSLENWNRPKAEVNELMRLLDHYLDAEIDEVMRNGIRLRSIGRMDRLPSAVAAKVRAAVERTRNNREMVLVFALSYGGRAEIVDAARELCREVELGKIEADSIDEKLFAAHLYDPELPDPDLLIRTGAESRVSNFLLWQIAYTEIYTTDRMWPEFRKPDLVEALIDYQSRERRFGLTGEQVRGGENDDA
ncbi:MAG: isoprenyl transferase [Myxococcota bacterium]